MKAWIDMALAVAAATIFTSLAVGKAARFEHFVGHVAGYRLGSAVLARPLARAVIVSELALSAGLIVPQWRRIAAVLAAGLLVVFMGAMVRVMRQGRREVDCGCSLRPGVSTVGATSLLRNAGLALFLLLVRSISFPAHADDLGATVVLNAAAAGVVLALLYLAIEAMAALPEVARRRRAYE
jgi:hypothetical protein